MTNSFFKCLDKIGGAVTYFRNFVLNSIFLFLLFIIMLTLLASWTVSAINNVKEEKKQAEQDQASVMIIDFGSEVTDNRIYVNPLDELLAQLENEEQQTSALPDLTYTLDAIAKGKLPHIKALFLDLSSLSYIRLDQAKILGTALDKIKSQHQNLAIYAYAPSYSQSVYALAAHANIIGLDPLGDVDIHGMALKTLYYKNLFDKIKLDVYTPKAGTHKSAVEPYNRSDMSPQVKTEYQGIVDDLWDQYKTVVLNARSSLTAEDFDTIFSGSDLYLPALRQAKGDAANLALKHKLVDTVVPYAQFLQRIAKDAGTKVVYNKSENNYRIKSSVSYQDYLTNEGYNPAKIPDASNSIAIVYGIGEITSSDEDDPMAFTPSNIIPQLNKIAQNPKIGAVVLYLNTPGGEVYASEQIRRKLLELKDKGKKIVVYMADMTASGGYWISTAADKIVADSSTITGSIGVLAITGSASRLAENFGITSDGVANSDTASDSIFLPINDKQKEIMQLSIDSVYHTFVNNVSKARNIPYDEANKIAQGRIYTGIYAQKIKLVDEIGDLNTAISLAHNMLVKKQTTPPKYFHSEPVVSSTMEMLNIFFAKAVSKVSEPAAIKLINGYMRDPVLRNTIKNQEGNQGPSPKYQTYSYTPLGIDY